MSEHLDLDALADHLVGEGDGTDHLSTCAACHDRLAELSAAQLTVSASLAALPPPPLPPDLAQRITAALAAEPSLAPGEPAPAEPAAAPSARSATVTPLAGRRPAPRRTWPLSVAAAVVLVCGAGLGYTLLADAGSDSAEQSTAADSAAGAAAPQVALPRSASDIDYADPASVTTGLPSVLDGSARREVQSGTADAERGAPPAPLASGSGAPGSAASSPGASGPEAALAADPLARLRDPAGLASCLLALLPPEDPGVRPLALDYARFGSTPALAVVLPDPDPTKVSVFVVGPGCSKDNDATLQFIRLARP